MERDCYKGEQIILFYYRNFQKGGKTNGFDSVTSSGSVPICNNSTMMKQRYTLELGKISLLLIYMSNTDGETFNLYGFDL